MAGAEAHPAPAGTIAALIAIVEPGALAALRARFPAPGAEDWPGAGGAGGPAEVAALRELAEIGLAAADKAAQRVTPELERRLRRVLLLRRSAVVLAALSAAGAVALPAADGRGLAAAQLAVVLLLLAAEQLDAPGGSAGVRLAEARAVAERVEAVRRALEVDPLRSPAAVRGLAVEVAAIAAKALKSIGR